MFSMFITYKPQRFYKTEKATKLDVVNMKLGWARINVIRDVDTAKHNSIDRKGCAIQTPFGLPVKKNILINRM